MGVEGQDWRAPQDMPGIVVVDSTASTNEDLMALGRQGAAHASCVAARSQSAGRGRRGHGWGSPAGGLYLSVLLRPKVPMSHLMGLSAVCGLGLVEALHELGATKAQLKWPNDVIIEACEATMGRERKLAGLLMEAGTGEAGMFAVAGVGINLAMPELEGDMGSVDPLPAAGISMAMAPGVSEPTFDELADAVRAHVAARCDRWSADVAAGRAQAGPLAPVLSDYFDALALMGEKVNVVYPNGRIAASGTFVAVDVWGRATVKLADGSEISVSSEQASLRRP